MKPAPFRYARPQSVEEALQILATHHEQELKILAGGQSLVPLMNFRLATPDMIVDINGLHELAHLGRRAGWLHIGALTRHSQLGSSPLVRANWPLLAAATEHIGHAQIRNAGTVGGSVAHADPSAELPVVLAALDAEFVVRGTDGSRSIRWIDFFVGPLETSLEPNEMLVEIRVPPPTSPGAGWGFEEFCRRDGDFALAGCAAQISVDPEGICRVASIALLGAGATPMRAVRAEQHLVGEVLSDETIDDAAALAAADSRPSGDMHGDAAYRRDLIREMTVRSLQAARTMAKETFEDV